MLRETTFDREKGLSQIWMMKENIFLQSMRGCTIMVVMWYPLSGDYFHLTIRLSLVTWNIYFVSNSKFIKLIIWATRILEIGMKLWLNIQVLNTLNLDNCLKCLWNEILGPLFYSRKLRSMLHWFIIFEFKLWSGAQSNFSIPPKLANSSQNVRHSARGQNTQISMIDVIRCVKPSTHYSIWGE